MDQQGGWNIDLEHPSLGSFVISFYYRSLTPKRNVFSKHPKSYSLKEAIRRNCKFAFLIEKRREKTSHDNNEQELVKDCPMVSRQRGKGA